MSRQEIKESRIDTDINTQTDKLRTQISRTRRRLMKADDEGKPTEMYTREIKRLKGELAKLEGHWITKFVFTCKKQKNGDYLAEGKFRNRIEQYNISKDTEIDSYRPWMSSDVVGHHKTLKEIKRLAEEQMKIYLGVKQFLCFGGVVTALK